MRRKWCETAVSSATDYSTLKVCFGGTSNTFEAVDAKNAEKAFSLVYKMACVGLERRGLFRATLRFILRKSSVTRSKRHKEGVKVQLPDQSLDLNSPHTHPAPAD